MRLPSEIITRNRYLDLLRPFIDKQVIKVLTGQRRVGKSLLLFQIMNEIKSNIPNATFIYINKEDLEYADIKNAEDLNQHVLKKVAEKGKTYVFIDEIQDIENIESKFNAVQFKVGKADLPEDAKYALYDLAKIMEKQPEVKISIEGHTSKEGLVDFNQKLSEKRAKAVVDFLVSRGVPIERLSYEGKGSSEPIDINNNDINRRTDFVIIK